MQLYERDFILNSILYGYSIYNISNKRIKYSYILPQDILYESSKLYFDTYNNAKEEEIMDDDDLYDFLCNNIGWSDEEEDRLLNKIPDYIDNCKIEMYNNYADKKYLQKARKYIKRAEDELDDLFNKRHSFDHLTCHGTATYAKYQFISENSIDIIDKLTQNELVEVMEKNNANRLSEEDIRELCLNEPWKSLWFMNKKIPIFTCSAINLSDNQKKMVQWSIMYDNIFENPECPPDEVINNHDLLDGWLLVKRSENKKDKKRVEIEKRIGKNANAGEVFIVAKSQDDIDDIYGLNDNVSKNIISNRIETIKKYGEVPEHKLNDVKQNLQMEYNKKAMGK